ncbi:MAG: PKD domain-containing protein, partial [Thermoplasmatota archaeon]
PPTGIVDECQTQSLHFEVQDDNPSLFSAQGGPHVDIYKTHEFEVRPYRDSGRPPRWVNQFEPTYGWFNFTLGWNSYGTANLNVCLVDDGIESGLAAGPGAVDRSCRRVVVTVPGPPMTHPDSYAAYAGRLLVETNGTGVLANDQNSTGTYYLASLNPPDAAGHQHGTYMTASLFSAPSHAANFQFNDDGSFQYLPDASFEGTDSFLYMARDVHEPTVTPETVTITVTHALPPGADFVWQPERPVANQQVTFTDRSGVAGAAVVSWAWDFGDGGSLGCNDISCRAPPHVYAAQGLYAGRLTIVDSKGDVDEATRLVNVAPAGPSLDARYVPPTFAPPVAFAGHNFSVASGAQVQLEGTGTPEETITGYSWMQLSGPAVHLANPQSASTTFLAPTLEPGEHRLLTFSFEVSDGRAQSAPSLVTVVVGSPNAAPTAHAGAPADVATATTVTLDASGSTDPDGDTLQYLWTQVQGPSVALSDAHAVAPTFVAPMTLSQTRLVFQVDVQDGHGGDGADRVVVTVRQAVAPEGFSFAVGGLSQPGRVAFTGGSPLARWDFGDGKTATGFDPVHVYDRSGVYPVTLTMGSKSYEAPVVITFHSVAPHALSQHSSAAGVLLVGGLAVAALLRRRAL